MKKVRTVLVGNKKLVRDGVSFILSGTPFEVISEFPDLKECASSDNVAAPDLVVLDFSPVDAEEVRLLRSLEARWPDAKVVILTHELCSRRLSIVLGARNVWGYLLQNMSAEALVQSLNLVMMGEKVFPMHLPRLLMTGETAQAGLAGALPGKSLSPRERQILGCLVRGSSNKVIANSLGITEATVKVHLKSLLRKINVSNRTQAAIWALNNGMNGDVPPAAFRPAAAENASVAQ
ncbi:MAG: response regulator transcription factor [Pseudomonadota bacterium]|nr:response regulator transcription factor [Pseudomonadota bacterium]